MSRKFYVKKVLCLLMSLLLITALGGCKKDTGYDVGKKAPAESHKIEKKKKQNLYLIREMNMNEEMITLESLQGTESVVRYPYSLSTKFKNRFGEIASWQSFYPGRVVTIGESAFYNCCKLTSVTICDGVQNIEEEAFCLGKRGCEELHAGCGKWNYQAW